MKRILTVIVLLMLVLGLSAEDYVDDFNGFDWVRWDQTQKSFFILGYWNALKCMEEINSIKKEKTTKADKIIEFVRINKVYDWFRVEGTVQDWIEEIDQFYSVYKGRPMKLWFVAGAAVRSDWFIDWKE